MLREMTGRERGGNACNSPLPEIDKPTSSATIMYPKCSYAHNVKGLMIEPCKGMKLGISRFQVGDDKEIVPL